MRVWFLEGYDGGSHRAFREGWTARSRHEIHALTLPARKWKWRMQGGAWLLAQRNDLPRPDVVFATDMINLAEFLGLARKELHGVPSLLYFHENQYSYPPQVADKPDYFWGAINVASALAADTLAFNSAYNRDDFFACWRRGNKVMPDGNLAEALLDGLQKAAAVVPVGIDFDFLDAHETPRDENAPPLILWNHRWEHDKQPEVFFDALRELKRRGVAFRLAVCGESFTDRPDCFEAARAEFGQEIDTFGFLESRAEYARLLWRSDIVVSTAIQEFLGLSVIEAMWCGARPVLPNRLSYPGLLPGALHGECLYGNDEDLADCLETTLLRGAFAPRPDFLHEYAWSQVSEALDCLVESTKKQRPQ